MKYDDSTKLQKNVDICHLLSFLSYAHVHAVYLSSVRPCTFGVPEFCREKFKFSFV